MTKTLNFLKNTALGAVEIYQRDGRIYLSRFSSEQREAYAFSPDFQTKTYATSGIVLEFETTADEFCIEGTVQQGSSRNFYYFDIYTDGIMTAHSGSEFDVREQSDFVLKADLCETDYSGSSRGKNRRIRIYFPQLACAAVKSISFDGVSVDSGCEEKYSFVGEHRNKALFYGDSITQGYDAEYPSYTYPAILSRRFSLDILNKGIGGDMHNACVLFRDSFVPDMIFTAYGTNDWNRRSEADFANGIENFYSRLRGIYPTTPVIAVTPVWRRDGNEFRPSCSFQKINETIKRICSKYNDITVIDGMCLVSRNTGAFSDKRLHPNDIGFFVYADSLCREILERADVAVCAELKERFHM